MLTCYLQEQAIAFERGSSFHPESTHCNTSERGGSEEIPELEKDEILQGLAEGYLIEEKIEAVAREEMTKGRARGRPRAEPGRRSTAEKMEEEPRN